MAESIEEVIAENKDNSSSSIEAFKRELQKIRTGRASAGLVEGINVDYYGSKTSLAHLGQITTPEANQILIQVFDAGAVESVEKAIMSSELGFNPSRDGNTLRIIVPPLTEERRKDIVKLLNKTAEDIRVSIRNHRRDANDAIKSLEKENAISKDDAKRATESIQKQTDLSIAEVDKLLAEKEEECLQV